MSEKTVSVLDVTLLKEKLAGGAVTLVDVRRAVDAEADPCRIPGAVWKDPAHLSAWLGDLPKDRPVALYCVRGGSVSQGAAAELAGQGLDATYLDGGLAAWKSAGGDLTAIRPDEEALLRGAGMVSEDVEHSGRVAANGLWLAEGLTLDREMLRRGCVFHDLGKVVDGSILHGVVGAGLGVVLGLEASACRAMLVHVRAGVPREEAARYNLPVADYRPRNQEEKLVIVADKLTDMVEDGYAADRVSAWKSFAETLRDNPSLSKDSATLTRYLALAEEVRSFKG